MLMVQEKKNNNQESADYMGDIALSQRMKEEKDVTVKNVHVAVKFKVLDHPKWWVGVGPKHHVPHLNLNPFGGPMQHSLTSKQIPIKYSSS